MSRKPPDRGPIFLLDTGETGASETGSCASKLIEARSHISPSHMDRALPRARPVVQAARHTGRRERRRQP